MASFDKRTYQSWRVTCDGDRSLNATYDSEDAAQARLRELSEQGLKGLKIKKFSSIGWQARVRLKGFPPLIKTFPRRDLAEEWAREKEGEIVKRQFIDYREAERHSLGDLLSKYDTQLLGSKPKDDPDRVRIAMLKRLPIANIKMSLLLASDVVALRDDRLQQVKGATVRKELELICRVIAVARREWKIFLAQNVASGELVRRPPAEPGDERDRRLGELHQLVSDQPTLASSSKSQNSKAQRRVRTDVEYETDPEVSKMLAMPQNEQQALLRACRYPHWYTERKRDVTAATGLLPVSKTPC